MIKSTSPHDPRVRALMDAQQTELRALYDDDTTEPFDPTILEGDGCVLLVDEEQGAFVCCGALKRWEDGDTAEVKRMYTVPSERGRGRGKALLQVLVERGRSLGYGRLVLETGNLQPATAALYEGAGFVRIPNYGFYENIEASLCYALSLRARSKPSSTDP